MGQIMRRAGQVVYAYMPYRDFKINHTGLKKRPVVIVSNEEYNKKSNSVIVCPMTTRIRENSWSKFVRISPKDSIGGKLVNCELRVDGLYNLPKKDIYRENGFLSDEKLNETLENIHQLFPKHSNKL